MRRVGWEQEDHLPPDMLIGMALCCKHPALVPTRDPTETGRMGDAPLKTLVTKSFSPWKQGSNLLSGSRGRNMPGLASEKQVLLEKEAVPVTAKTAWSSYLYPGVQLKHQSTWNSKSLAYLPPHLAPSQVFADIWFPSSCLENLGQSREAPSEEWHLLG